MLLSSLISFLVALIVFSCALPGTTSSDLRQPTVNGSVSRAISIEPQVEAAYFGVLLSASESSAPDRPHIVPAVSGNEELDALLAEILETEVGYDGEALRRAYEWVGNYDNFNYVDMDYVEEGDPWGNWSVPFAIEMAQNHEGNCYRFAALMCWIARALGYEARAVDGDVLTEHGWVAHGWVEIDQGGEIYIIDAQQHARPQNEGYDFFMVTYDDAPLYYYIESLDEDW